MFTYPWYTDYLLLGCAVVFLCFWALCHNHAPPDPHSGQKTLSLIPLFVFIGAQGTGPVLNVMCLALFNPDVYWDRKNNPEPCNKLCANDQCKLYSVNIDYNKLKKVQTSK